MSADEFAEVACQASIKPESLTTEALQAAKEIIDERNLDVPSLIQDEIRTAEAQKAARRLKRASRSRSAKQNARILGKVMGVLGILAGIGILAGSISQAHVGGAIASVAVIATSAWLLLCYQGD
jgi:hypothetical protein